MYRIKFCPDNNFRISFKLKIKIYEHVIFNQTIRNPNRVSYKRNNA